MSHSDVYPCFRSKSQAPPCPLGQLVDGLRDMEACGARIYHSSRDRFPKRLSAVYDTNDGRDDAIPTKDGPIMVSTSCQEVDVPFEVPRFSKAKMRQSFLRLCPDVHRWHELYHSNNRTFRESRDCSLKEICETLSKCHV